MHDFDPQESVPLCRDAGEIFFRAADVTRFERVFDAVVQQSQYVLMTSQFDGVIDHYGKMMLNRLKMRSGMAVETYMPASTEALVSRFNELLEQMSVEEARGETPSKAAGRIIIVNDARAIESDGWALLSRMITDFPGLNMRLVFLLDRIPANVEKAIDRFGSRVLRWEIEPPTGAEQLALRKEGMQNGLEFQVERVLSRINQTVSQQLEPTLDGDPADASLQLDVEDALGGASEAGEREAEDMRALFEEEPPKQRAGVGLLVLLLILVVAPIATVIAGFVSPDVGRRLDQALATVGVTDSVFSRPRSAQSVVDAAYDTESSETMPQLRLPELEPMDQATLPETPRTGLAEEIAQADSAQAVAQGEVRPDAVGDEQRTEEIVSDAGATDPTPELTVDEVSTDQVAQSAETQSPSAPLESTEPSEASEANQSAEADVPEESGDAVNAVDASESAGARAAQPDPVRQLISNARADSQFVQHIVFVSPGRARAWLQSQSNVPRAVVTPIQVNGSTQYAVVSGPFESRAVILEYIQGLGEDADYWIRTAESLQRILPEEG